MTAFASTDYPFLAPDDGLTTAIAEALAGCGLERWRVPLTQVTEVAWSRVVNKHGMTMASLLHLATATGKEVFVAKDAQHLAERLEAFITGIERQP